MTALDPLLTLIKAFEGYDSSKDIRAIKTLKYMCLCKVIILFSIFITLDPGWSCQ